MEPIISRIRTRRSGDRDRVAVRENRQQSALRERPGLRFPIGLLLWLATVCIVDAEAFMELGPAAATRPAVAARALILLVGICSTGLLLELTRPALTYRLCQLAPLAAAAAIAVGTGKALAVLTGILLPNNAALSAFVFPFAMGPLLGTLLLGPVAGLAAGMWTSIAAAVMAPAGYGPAVAVCGLAATAAGSSLARGVRTRARVVRVGLTAAVVQTAGVLVGAAASDRGFTEVADAVNQAAACLVSGYASAWMALLLLPLIENVCRVTSDITLLELTDPAHPLLQRLALEAPGTYHHSLTVANLAGAAADAIGANALLVRVCACFHDIGKLTKPEFFSENQDREVNPHDDLLPSMSTLIITAHVKEGLSLGMRYKLPEAVLQAIREHHGTGVLACFYHKAKSQLDSETAPAGGGAAVPPRRLSDVPFRYPGPKPSSRESVIVAQADAVEAASRAMVKVTPAGIQELVNEIVFHKLEDGQLDNAPLTVEELARIRQSLVFSLTSMHHGRVSYPTDEDRSAQPEPETPH